MSAATSTPSGTQKPLNWRPIAIGVGIVLVLAPLVWWLMRASATEVLLDTATLTLDGKSFSVNLHEKTLSNEVSGLNGDANARPETGRTHLGYALSLYDSAAARQLDRIEFDSPVRAIQSDPQLIPIPPATIWLVSTSPSTDDDKRGFVLRFSAATDKLQQEPFSLDEHYRIRSLDGSKVILTEGASQSGGYMDPVHGAIYLELESGQIVDGRR